MPNTNRQGRRWVLAAALALAAVMLALIAAWHWTPLQELAEPRAVARWLNSVEHTPWLLPLVALVYVAASLVAFPNTVLCLGVILALGPLAGTAYAFGGSVAAALVGYTLGRRGGKRVKKLRFRGFERMSEELRRGGFMQVLGLRLLPIAPFTVTNILAGAARVRLLPYIGATVVGIAPYILTFALFGHQARRLLANPTSLDIAVTVAIVILATLALWRARTLAAARHR